MSSCEKCHILNELVNPLGYEYDKEQDIFTSTPDAWQKNMGMVLSMTVWHLTLI